MLDAAVMNWDFDIVRVGNVIKGLRIKEQIKAILQILKKLTNFDRLSKVIEMIKELHTLSI